MLAACSVMVREPICTASPNGTTAKVIITGNSARNGARPWRNLSAPSGTKSSLVKSFSGSAISVLTRPRLGRPIRLPSPVIEARLAPIRSWMSALPLRSNHNRTPARLSTITTTTIALMASISRSISTGGKLVDKPVDGFLGQVFVVALVVELEHRRGGARGEAFDQAQGEFAVGGGLAGCDAERASDTTRDPLGTAQPARQVGANLEVPAPNRRAMEHRVEADHGVDVRGRQVHQAGDVFPDGERDPSDRASCDPQRGQQRGRTGRLTPKQRAVFVKRGGRKADFRAGR